MSASRWHNRDDVPCRVSFVGLKSIREPLRCSDAAGTPSSTKYPPQYLSRRLGALRVHQPGLHRSPAQRLAGAIQLRAAVPRVLSMGSRVSAATLYESRTCILAMLLKSSNAISTVRIFTTMGRRGFGRSLPLVFKSQVPFAAAACLTLVPVLVALTFRSMNSQPIQRPYLPYDASISMAMYPDTVHPILAPLVPFLALLATLIGVELWASRQWTPASANILHYTLDAVLANIVTMCITGWLTCFVAHNMFTNAASTEVTKVAVGKLRPDYLDRCQPPHVYNTTAVIQWADTQPPAECARCDDDICVFWVAGLKCLVMALCANTYVLLVHTHTLSGASLHVLVDGRKSFPSGHSSSSACGSVYAAAYVLYTAFAQTPGPCMPPGTCMQRRALFASQLWLAAALYWALALLLYTLFVGVTRYGLLRCLALVFVQEEKDAYVAASVDACAVCQQEL